MFALNAMDCSQGTSSLFTLIHPYLSSSFVDRSWLLHRHAQHHLSLHNPNVQVLSTFIATAFYPLISFPPCPHRGLRLLGQVLRSPGQRRWKDSPETPGLRVLREGAPRLALHAGHQTGTSRPQQTQVGQPRQVNAIVTSYSVYQSWGFMVYVELFAYITPFIDNLSNYRCNTQCVLLLQTRLLSQTIENECKLSSLHTTRQ